MEYHNLGYVSSSFANLFVRSVSRNILQSLSSGPGSMVMIGQFAKVSRSQVTNKIYQLENMKLVTSYNNGRLKYVKLTKRGHMVLRHINSVIMICNN